MTTKTGDTFQIATFIAASVVFVASCAKMGGLPGLWASTSLIVILGGITQAIVSAIPPAIAVDEDKRDPKGQP